MAITFNGGNDPDEVIYNNVSVDRVVFNGTTVWEKYSEVTILDLVNDYPEGVYSVPYDNASRYCNAWLFKNKGEGDHSYSSTPINFDSYEIGLIKDPDTDQYITDDRSFYIRYGYRITLDTTKYNTCLVDAYSNSSTQFWPVGTVGNHQYILFTMMNNDELLNDCCGGASNWAYQGQDAWGHDLYWWNSNILYPNNTTQVIPYDGYDSHTSQDPKPEWWSEVPWNRKLGFACHIAYYTATGTWQESKGPCADTNYSNYLTYGQTVKFSIKGLNGNRYFRALLIPFSCNGTSDDYGGSASGAVNLLKITLNTNKLE